MTTEEQIQQEIAYYNSLPVIFDGFIELPVLTNGEIALVCTAKKPAIPEKKYVPAYDFEIHKNGERIGLINLRLGYTDSLYYGGQIGYGINEEHRGNGYAGEACRLLIPIMKAHGMTTVIISNNHTNESSKRVCEKLGAKFVRTAPLPEWHELYQLGQRYENIFEWKFV